MPLVPFFSLSALNPWEYTYSPANLNAPWANANIAATYGGVVSYQSPFRLADQHGSDQILLGLDPVPETNQTITNLYDDIYRRCALVVGFTGYGVSTANQYLLVFRLARQVGSPIAQFFVGTQFVLAEALTQSPYDDVAILLDTPGDAVLVRVVVRLAGPGTGNYHGFFFKGVDCYLL